MTKELLRIQILWSKKFTERIKILQNDFFNTVLGYKKL